LKSITRVKDGVNYSVPNIPIGMKWGRLTVQHHAPEKVKGRLRHFYICICECGKTCRVVGECLISGHTISCGCYHDEVRLVCTTTHGDSRPGSKYKRLFESWGDMIRRCEKEKRKDYHHYGGRGIFVCNEWKDYQTFKDWALANGYNEKLSLDRINNDLGYSPSNCKYSTAKQQARNRRNNYLLTAFDETKSIAEWVEDSRCSVNYSTVHARATRLKWPHEKAITEPGR